MVDFLTKFMPWCLTIQYFLLFIIFGLSGKPGVWLYWAGATILNIGVMIMSDTIELK